MKKYSICISFFFCFSLFSQETIINDIENSRTGNFKDAFYNIIQLTTKNLTDDEKSLELNTTLFKIIYNAELKSISDLTINKSYFLRNFQINAKANFDENYKYSGFSGGFTFAIINKRDKVTLNLAKTLYGKSRETFIIKFAEIQSKLAEGLTNGSKDLELLNEASDNLLNSLEYDATENPYHDLIQAEFAKVANDFVNPDGTPLDSNEISSFIATLAQLRKSEMDKIDGKPLWTLAADGTTNVDGKFTKSSVSSVFLKGIDKSGDQIDVRGTFTYDEETVPTMPRTIFNGKAGLNFVLLRNRIENSSCFEVKALGEYTKIYKNVLPDEDDETITANAEFRIRIANDFWIPVTVKYDIENSNLLGFLNLTYNFGS